MTGFTEQEVAGFAFYRLAHKHPDFDDWIAEDTQAHKKNVQTPEQRIIHEKDLETGFGAFMPGHDTVTLTSIGTVTLPVVPPEDAARLKDKRPMEIGFGDPGEATYFPVHVGQVWIAIVLSDAGAFKTLMLNKIEEARVRRILTLATNASAADAGIKITLRPTRVDTDTPVLLDHKKMWLMLGTVENLEIWDKSFKHIAWSYNAPGYMTDETRDLMNLYQGK